MSSSMQTESLEKVKGLVKMVPTEHKNTSETAKPEKPAQDKPAAPEPRSIPLLPPAPGAGSPPASDAPAGISQGASAAAPEPAAVPPRKPIDPTQANVLVVEDNVANFVLIARLLAYMGVQHCEWKTSGWQVVEFADTLPHIDLILMDIRLPYEDGFQALQKLRNSARLKETPVVAVTAEASVEQMKRAKEAGFDGFLGKPLDPDRFPDQIRRIMRGESVWELG